MAADNFSELLERLWEKRDHALKVEKNNGIAPRTSDFFKKIQKEIDDYFFPKQEKANRRKPKKKFIQEDEWLY